MIAYRFLSPAEEEMSEAALFYEAAATRLGSDFLDDVQRAIERVCDFPQIGEAVPQGLRRILFHRFPFSLIYAIEDDGIVIVAVAHQGRSPRYWQSRTSQ